MSLAETLKEQEWILREYADIQKLENLLKVWKTEIEPLSDPEIKKKEEQKVRGQIEEIIKWVTRSEKRSWRYKNGLLKKLTTLHSENQKIKIEDEYLTVAQHIELYSRKILLEVSGKSEFARVRSIAYHLVPSKKRKLNFEKLGQEIEYIKTDGFTPLLALLKQLVDPRKEVEYRRKYLSQLRELNFPVEKYPDIAEFLIRHWVDVMRIEAHDPYLTNRGLFYYGFTGIREFITEENWSTIVDMILRARALPQLNVDLALCLLSSLKELKDLIQRGVITFPKAVAGLLSMTKEIVLDPDYDESYFEGFYNFGIRYMRDAMMAGIVTWKQTQQDLPKIVNAVRGHATDLFCTDLPDSEIVTKERWNDLVGMINDSGTNGRRLIQELVIAFKNCSWRMDPFIWVYITKLVHKMKERAPPIIETVLNSLLKDYKAGIKEWEVIEKFINRLLKEKELFNLLSFIPREKYDQLVKSLDSNAILSLLRAIDQDPRYATVEGLQQLGFLVCHVTNAFGGGAALKKMEERRNSPFENIITCLQQQDTTRFQLSASTINPKTRSSIALTKRYGINGSIGVVLDSGYIYESYSADAATKSGTKEQGLQNSSYRTGEKRKRVSPGIAVNYGTGRYNELLIRRWTVGGLFYTKGVQADEIEKLKDIAKEYSNKIYINPGYINRKTKYGVPERIKKVYPLFEIDTERNTWAKVYVPRGEI